MRRFLIQPDAVSNRQTTLTNWAGGGDALRQVSLTTRWVLFMDISTVEDVRAALDRGDESALMQIWQAAASRDSWQNVLR